MWTPSYLWTDWRDDYEMKRGNCMKQVLLSAIHRKNKPFCAHRLLCTLCLRVWMCFSVCECVPVHVCVLYHVFLESPTATPRRPRTWGTRSFLVAQSQRSLILLRSCTFFSASVLLIEQFTFYVASFFLLSFIFFYFSVVSLEFAIYT